MDKSTLKKVRLFVIFAAMLGGLGLIIKYADPNPNHSVTPLDPTHPPIATAKLDPAKLTVQWPQIVAHAAAPPRGAANTPYTLAEFGDFQCPQCGKARPLLEKMLAQYPDKINLIFIHRPFSLMHQWAIPAGQASEIAAAQGKFWPMYDVLYSHQDDLESGYYANYAGKAGLDSAQFQKAFDAGQGQSQIKTATDFSDALKIEATPTILVHNNKTGKITIYCGMEGTKNPDSTMQYPGVVALAASPPWAG